MPTPLVDTIVVATSVAASAGSAASTQIVKRLRGATVYVLVTTVPSPLRKRASISAAAVSGFAISTNVSKKVPVAPSARCQVIAVSVRPALESPAAHTRSGESRYIERSTTIGTRLGR